MAGSPLPQHRGYLGGVRFRLPFPFALDGVLLDEDCGRDFVADDGTEIFLTDPPETAETLGGLLAGDDVGVSPGDDGVRGFVESEDTINESLSTAEDADMAIERRRNGFGERIGMVAGKGLNGHWPPPRRYSKSRSFRPSHLTSVMRP